MVVVFSKEKPQHCGNCNERLESICFRCLECGEIVSCPKCNPRGCREDVDPPSRPWDHLPYSRGNFANRGRSCEALHVSFPRGGFSSRGFMARPNFPPTGPFPGGNRGFGFGPRGFGGFRACFPASRPVPPSFRPVSVQGGVDDFPEMHDCSFGPFPVRGHPRFPRGFQGRGGVCGRGGFSRGRGGMRPSLKCNECECNHMSIFPEIVKENDVNLREGASVVDGAEGNIPDNGREINRQNIDDAMGGTDPKPVDKNLEG